MTIEPIQKITHYSVQNLGLKFLVRPGISSYIGTFLRIYGETGKKCNDALDYVLKKGAVSVIRIFPIGKDGQNIKEIGPPVA